MTAVKQRLPVRLAALLLAVSLLLCLPFAYRAGLSDLAFFEAEKAVAHWGEAARRPHPEIIARADTAIARALSLWPSHPDYLSLAAQIRGWEGFTESEASNNPKLAEDAYREAIVLLRQSLLMRPAYAKSWALLAEYKALVGERDEEWFQARDKALALGGADINLVNRMMRL